MRGELHGITPTDRFLALGEAYRALQARLFDTRLTDAERERIERELAQIEREREALRPQ